MKTITITKALQDKKYQIQSVGKKYLNDASINEEIDLETIFNITKDGIAIIDLDTRFLYFNNSYLKMTGYTKEELLSKTSLEISAPEDVDRSKRAIEKVIKEGFLDNFEKTYEVKNGKRFIANISFTLMPDEKRILVSIKDITILKQKEKLIQDYIDLINMNVITSSTDLKGTITHVSDAFCNISGYSKDELIGKNHRILKHSHMNEATYTQLWNTITLDKVWTGEVKNRKKDGDSYWVKARISPVFNEFGAKVGYSSVREDITDKKKLEEICITDGLTNIYNRRHFDDIFYNTYNQDNRDDSYEFFLILDIDYFKEYNDYYGHHFGDDALKSLAKSLQRSLRRKSDYCFRLGGEEFAVLYRASTKQKGIEYARQIKQDIENLKIDHIYNTASNYLTVSLGLVCINKEIKNQSKVYKQADKLLYEAKKSGRNQLKFDIST